MPIPSTLADLPTPSLVIERSVFDANVQTMADIHPGSALRPHVKAFKSTALAARLEEAGHRSFCAATVSEVAGMAQAGVGNDLLLANEVLDYRRLTPLVEQGADITVAIDSEPVLAAAVAAGMQRALIDVEVGLPRCGCDVDHAGRLAEQARAAGIEVRGVMGYEGHLMMVKDPDERRARVHDSMERLLRAHQAVGGDIVSAGGTGTAQVNTWANEIQAGSYCLMDTHYATLEVPFQMALTVLATVISVSPKGWAVADAGLKAFGMDHGNPSWPDGRLLFCSDEHTTIAAGDEGSLPAVGDRIRFLPAHVDPTVAKHERFWVVDGDDVVDEWPIDLRHW